MRDERLLKKDLFGEIRHRPAPDGGTIVRDTTRSAFWLRAVARRLLCREARALATLDGLDGAPSLVSVSRDCLERAYVAGRPMQEAKPRDPDFYRRALRRLRRLHAAGVVHNDLAKEPNILASPLGDPVFIDYQLASVSRHRGRLFRILAYEDVRHLLKHKRTYCAEALTARQRRILANPSSLSRGFRRIVKPAYLFVTRTLLGWADREGAGDRGGRRA